MWCFNVPKILYRSNEYCEQPLALYASQYIVLSGKINPLFMADVAQLVRAPVCGTGGRGFNSHHSPQDTESRFDGIFIL